MGLIEAVLVCQGRVSNSTLRRYATRTGSGSDSSGQPAASSAAPTNWPRSVRVGGQRVGRLAFALGLGDRALGHQAAQVAVDVRTAHHGHEQALVL